MKSSSTDHGVSDEEIEFLEALERKIRWLSAWTIHNANHLRPNRDGLKVGGHQASCASMSAIMTALYFHTLRPEDRVAVKPHAGPVFHAIQYLLGNQTLDKLKAFRAYGGVQSYPSRTKDNETVDFSTGSVGLGAAMTNFSSTNPAATCWSPRWGMQAGTFPRRLRRCSPGRRSLKSLRRSGPWRFQRSS